MISEDKVFRKLKETPEIFCIVDDLCKVFDAQMANIQLRQKESANITVKAACQR